MIFIGDIHGNFPCLNPDPAKSYLQVGDLGLGFPNHPYPNSFSDNFKFIRGNHDNPEVCRNHPNYLGEYGYKVEQDLFYLSGAFSVDFKSRTMGIDIWEDEELAWGTLLKATDLYKQIKPRILVAHECPTLVKYELFKNHFKMGFRNRTADALQAMFESHQPELMIFGHYHINKRQKFWNTDCVCLGIEQTLEIPDLKW